MNSHMNSKTKLAKYLRACFYRFQDLNPKIHLQYFRIYVLPIITFLVIPLIHSGLKQVQSLQNKFLRLHKIPWEDFKINVKIHRELKIPSTY